VGVPNPANILTVAQNSATDPIADDWATYSSRTYKEGIRELTPAEYQEALRAVLDMRVVHFRYQGQSDSAKEQIGVIAEEAPAQMLAEGNDKAIGLNDYVSLLHAAIKAQQEQIDALQRQLDELTQP
jgi:hypothetical protein